MDLNKSFLLHMSQNAHTVGIHDKKDGGTVAPAVPYTNEFVLKIPQKSPFLDTNPDTNTSSEELEVLIQQKLKERDSELFEIQKHYNPEDKIESVKLIKISDVLADLNVLGDENDIPIANENNKQKVTIGDTVVYNYNKNDPPEQLNVNNEEIVDTLKSIIAHMNIIDKKLDDLIISIQPFINT
jgi:hypothetical protein